MSSDSVGLRPCTFSSLYSTRRYHRRVNPPSAGYIQGSENTARDRENSNWPRSTLGNAYTVKLADLALNSLEANVVRNHLVLDIIDLKMHKHVEVD